MPFLLECLSILHWTPTLHRFIFLLWLHLRHSWLDLCRSLCLSFLFMELSVSSVFGLWVALSLNCASLISMLSSRGPDAATHETTSLVFAVAQFGGKPGKLRMNSLSFDSPLQLAGLSSSFMEFSLSQPLISVARAGSTLESGTLPTHPSILLVPLKKNTAYRDISLLIDFLCQANSRFIRNLSIHLSVHSN